jgi:hypothetical protein
MSQIVKDQILLVPGSEWALKIQKTHSCVCDSYIHISEKVLKRHHIKTIDISRQNKVN